MEYQTLKQTLINKGFLFFEKTDYDLNFIWVRNSLVADNHFTDDLYVAYKTVGVERVLNIKCTTKPGLKNSLYNPVTVEGITGTAIIKEGQYLQAWEFHDTYKEFSCFPYFRQIKNIDYFRDGNKDNIIDEVQEQDDKLFGTHWHRMSNIGDLRMVEQFEVNNWSEGCMGAPISEWTKVIDLMRKAILAGQSTVVTGTIIDATNFNS
jgi:hypothetical protein